MKGVKSLPWAENLNYCKGREIQTFCSGLKFCNLCWYYGIKVKIFSEIKQPLDAQIVTKAKSTVHNFFPFIKISQLQVIYFQKVSFYRHAILIAYPGSTVWYNFMMYNFVLTVKRYVFLKWMTCIGLQNGSVQFIRCRFSLILMFQVKGLQTSWFQPFDQSLGC